MAKSVNQIPGITCVSFELENATIEFETDEQYCFDRLKANWKVWVIRWTRNTIHYLKKQSRI